MPIELKMPALSPTMEEGTLAQWLVNVGDHVVAGDILAEIETDNHSVVLLTTPSTSPATRALVWS